MVIEQRSALYDQTTGYRGAAKCPNCKWEGQTKATIAAFFKDKDVIWSIERIGAVLLGVVTEYAAAPMVQVFEFAGMVEADDMEGKGEIMKACVEAVTTAGFMKAHELHVAKLKERLENDDIDPDEMKLIKKVVERLEQTKTHGQNAFEAYNESRGGVNFKGDKTPDWPDLPEGIREAWEVAAAAARA
jgi:hypothetical protein